MKSNFFTQRRSVLAKKMSSKNIPDEDLNKILAAGIRVPDHGALNPWKISVIKGDKLKLIDENIILTEFKKENVGGKEYYTRDVKSTETTVPFFKESEFDYASLLKWMGDGYEKWAWLIYIPIVILIITAVSNGANLTDGIDGLASGTSAIIGTTLAVLAYVSGNKIFADYLNIMYIPNLGELVIFAGAFVGACVGVCEATSELPSLLEV